MSHANALLAPKGRLKLARTVVDDGWSLRRAAERFQVSPTTAKKWADRYRAGGPAAMVDRSSRPHHSPARTPTRTERRIINLRFTRRWGPHRIAYHLHLAHSTVGAVLTRFRMPLLRHLDQNTGLSVRRPDPHRYEHDAPGDLVHIDIKKLGRIPDGGGHRKLGRAVGRRNSGQRGSGYSYVHHAIDDHSRMAYSEILGDERKETAAAFYERAKADFAGRGITIRAVLTDNGSCYRSRLFAETLGPDVKHRRTRPYRPQTNGKVERFNRTLNQEWAYACTYLSDDARAATYQDWLHQYNHHRPHTGIGGLSPIDRLTVHDLPGKNT
ncbi:IS481 family transposase [Rhodococcus qingshengii]|uniref:IS481 family transposase n=1 Tax=Rhodococcus TaxID=1827 RepID=UPI001AE9FA26|nr:MULTISPECIES: IS481 family transposase [Rhodococcus]MBP1054756.1 IS481 family transposase [Rhodococcus qingshengii]MBP2527353.1 transposase InsO family protein [Rhodococcus sp. PvP104]